MSCQAQPFCSPRDGRALRHRPQWDRTRTFAPGSRPGEVLSARGRILLPQTRTPGVRFQVESGEFTVGCLGGKEACGREPRV